MAVGIDPATLIETLAEFGSAAVAGHDRAFHRPTDRLQTLEGPFYAIPSCPGSRRRPAARGATPRRAWCAPAASPIPGLFAAGGAGSIWGGQVTEQGGGLTDGIVFGRIAGTVASR